ncbi:MAG: septal ring lytic transglycosylase RlpA family protein [Beijerinckiaceae bacterium]
MTVSPKPAALCALAVAAFCALALNFARAETCRASWYSHGTRTANGERFHPDGFTAAHRSIAFGTMIGVRRGSRKIAVRINDRGPFVAGRCLDLSRGAARALGIISAGTALVRIERP